MTAAFQPSSETVSVVRQWLIDAGIKNSSITHSDNRGWFAFHASADQVESLLHTEYHEYEDRHTGGIMPACEQYHVPAHVKHHIDYITPGVKLLAPPNAPTQKETLKRRGTEWPGPHGGPSWKGGKPWQGPGLPFQYGRPSYPYSILESHNKLNSCDIAITPACVAALYQIPPSHGYAHPNNSMGIFEAELQFFDQEDLNLFFTNFTHWIPNGTHPIADLIDGGVAVTTNVSEAGGEALLDLELTYPIVYPQTVTVFNVDDLHYQTWANDTYTWGFNTLLDAIDGSYCE